MKRASKKSFCQIWRDEIYISACIVLAVIVFYWIGRCDGDQTTMPIADHKKIIAEKQHEVDSLQKDNIRWQDCAADSRRRYDSALTVISKLEASRKKIKKGTHEKITSLDAYTSDSIIKYWAEQSLSSSQGK